MKLNNKLKVYVLLAILYSFLTVPFLKSSWDNYGAGPGVNYQLGPNSGDILIGAVYAFLLLLSGFVLVRLNAKRKYRGNVALQYHLAASSVVSVAAVAGWLSLTYFGWRYVAWLTIVAWGSYGLHWLSAHNDPKGINKQGAFK